MVDSPAAPATSPKKGKERATLRPKVVDFNLIPLEFRRTLVTAPRLFLLTVIVTVAIAFPRLYETYSEVDQRAVDLRTQLNAMNDNVERENRRVNTQKAEATNLTNEIARLKEELAQKSTRAAAESRTVRRVGLAPGLELVLSGAARLEIAALTWLEPRLTVEGKAADLPALMSYTDKLRQSGRFRGIQLRLVNEVLAKPTSVASPPQSAARSGTPVPPPPPTPVPPPVPSGLAFVLEIDVDVDGPS